MMPAMRWLVAGFAAVWLPVGADAARDANEVGGPFAAAIDSACQRVVKLYGGKLGREAGYGSGLVVSADGRIVTTLSILIEGRSLRAVLPDGQRYAARVVARDQRRQLALLEIDAYDLPHFEPRGSQHLRPGDWLIAVANPFKVADGPEPVSVSVGVLSARTNLSARRRAQAFPYDGPVLLTDVIVATPGSAGGALVDADGSLVGLIGKAVISEQTNTWVNYALPVEEVAAFLDELEAEPPGASPDQSPVIRAATVRERSDRDPSPDREGEPPPPLGFRLFDVGGREPPPYVERVRAGSPAWQAGLRPNDLILEIGGQRVVSCAELGNAVSRLRQGQRVSLVIKRGDEIKTLELTLEEPNP
jgi:serine protease Do